MRLLHVSDLHACQRDTVDRGAILLSFLDDVAQQHAEKQIEVIVVTGDIAFAGLADEYRLAEQYFLNPLLERLELGRDRIVLAPGNHDIDRTRIDDYTEAGLRQNLNSREELTSLFDDAKLHRYIDRLNDYRAFHRDFYSEVAVHTTALLANCHRVDTSVGQIGFAALNTAWRATGSPNDGDRGYLLLGDRQVRGSLDHLNDCSLRVAAMHHPLDWLAPFDADDVRVDLERRFDVILLGHLHEPEPQQLVSTRGHCIYGRAGCLYEHFQYPNSYSLLDLDPMVNQVTFLVRRYFPARRAFDSAVDLAPNGRVEFELRSPTPTTAARAVVERVPYNVVLGVLVEIAHETSVLADHVAQLRLRSVGEILVPPVFLPVPHEQAVAALEPGTSRRVERVDILELLGDHQCVVVAGNPETGLTSSLLWTLESYYLSDGRLPVYLRFSDIGPGRDPVKRAITAALSRLPEASTGNAEPLLAVGIDEVDPRSPKAFKRLVTHIASNSDNRFLLGCHAESHDMIMRSLEDAGISRARVFLGPFGRRELKMLARKFLGGLDRPLVDRVLGILRSEQLPRTPFLMAALVVVLDATDLPPGERSETAIIERYVNLLLGRVSPTEDARLALDFRNYEHILSSFAEHLVERGSDRVSRLESEAFLIEYWQNKGWEGSPSRVLDALVERRMLIEDRDGVGFRHRALHHLFIAKQMFEDEAFRQAVMESPLEFSSAVRHAAALNRSDRDLLVTVGKVLEACLADLSGIDEALFPRIDAAPGWSHAPDLERAARSLRPVPELPPEVVDEHMDDMWDDIEAADIRAVEEPGAPSPRFLASVELLSSVLRNSELVDDVDLKERLLREALRGWGVVAVLGAIFEDQTHLSREMIEDLFEGMDEDGGDESHRAQKVERIVKVSAVFFAGIGVLMALGSVKMTNLLERVLDDDEFMSVPANAFFATFLYVHLTQYDRGRRLTTLFKDHGSNTVLRDIVHFLCLLAYYRETLSKGEETVFENLLVDIGLSDQGVRGTAERVAARNFLLKELRKSRIRAASKHELDDGGLLDVEIAPPRGETQSEAGG